MSANGNNLCDTCFSASYCCRQQKLRKQQVLLCEIYKLDEEKAMVACKTEASRRHRDLHPATEQPALPMAEGRKDDAGKPRFELLAPEALEGTASILTFGARKYSDRNWEKGMKWSRVFGALMRHLWAWWNGQQLDTETGESHLHHAACCLMFLQAYEARMVGEDDRPQKAG